MEVENQLTVSVGSISQAAAFADAFLKMFRNELADALEDILPELGHFRLGGGTLVLTGIPFDIADDFQKEYRDIFLKTAHDVPDVPFLAMSHCQGDLESIHRFSYECGVLKRSYLWLDGSMDKWDCPKCGTQLPEPVSLPDVLDFGTKAVCPGCGRPVFPEVNYYLAEEEIRLDEYFSFSGEDIKHALSFCRNHKPELEKDSRCGCFFCQEIFSPAEVEDWDTEDDNDRGTALCPRCDAPTFGYYTVIGESSGYPITADFLRQVNDYWKWEELQK